MNADLLEAHLAQAVADLRPLFTSERLKEELFTYCETTSINVSRSYFFTKKSGHIRRRSHEVIISQQSTLLPEKIVIKWDNLEDFLVLVGANLHKEGKDPLKGYVVCSIVYIYNSDIRLKEIRLNDSI